MAKDLNNALNKTDDQLEQEKNQETNLAPIQQKVDTTKGKPVQPIQQPVVQEPVAIPVQQEPLINQPNQIIVLYEPNWDEVPDFDLLDMLTELENNPP